MADETGLKIIASLGVDYSSAITSIQDMAKAAGDLNAQLATIKASATEAGGALNASMSAGSAGVTSIETETKAASVSVQDLGVKAQTTGSFLDNMYSPSFIARHLGFILTAGALYGTFELADEGIVKYEQGLKGLTTVLPELAGNQQALNQVGQELIQTTERFGTSMDDSLAIAKNFGRAYKDSATVLGLVDQVTKLNIVDNVELSDAQAGVQAGLSTYGKAFQDTNDVLAFSGDLIDKITNLAHNALVNATDLTVGLQKSSAAALNAGVSLDQFLGLMAAGTKTTGLPGAQIAQALKTIFAQLAAPSKQVEEDLDKIGIKVRDANGNLRDAYDIILDLSKATKDSTYSQEDLNTAIEKVARGSVNYSKLAAIVGNYGEIVKDVDLSQQAAGKTNEVAAQQLDTLARKLQTTKNILIGMFADAGTSGLSVELKGLVDAINQLLLGLSKVSPLVLDAGVTLAGLGITIKVATGMYDFFAGAVARFIPLKIADTAATVAETGALEAETVATDEAAAATGILDAVMDANPVVLVTLAVMGLIGVLGAYIYHAGAAQKQQLELNSSTDASSGSIETATKKYDDLTDKLAKAQKGTKEYKDLQGQVQDSIKEIGKIMPGCVTAYDDEGHAIAIDCDKLQNYINLQNEAAQAAANSAAVRAEAAVNVAKSSIGQLNSQQGTIEEEIAAENRAAATGQGGLYDIKYGRSEDQLQQDLTAVETQMNQAAVSLDAAKTNYGNAWKSWQDVVNGVTSTSSNNDNNPVGGGTPNSNTPSGGSGSSTDQQAEALKALEDESDKYKIANDTMTQSLTQTATALTINQSQIDLLSDRMKNGTATVKDYADYQSLLTDRQSALKQEQAGLTQQNTMYNGELVDLNKTLETAEQKYNAFAAAGDTTHLQEAQTAVQKLQTDISDLTKTINDNTVANNKDQASLEDLANQVYDTGATNLENYLKDFKDLGLIDAGQELGILNTIDLQSESFDGQLETVKEIVAARKEQLTDEETKAVAAIQAQKDAYDSLATAQITSLQSELDLLKQQDSTQQEITDLQDKETANAQAQLDLATAQTKLNNVESQKNERVYSNGAWGYTSNASDVTDAQNALTSAQTTANNAYTTLLSAQRTYQEDQLQSQIDAAKTAQTAQDKTYDQQITDAKSYFEKLINNVLPPEWAKMLTQNTTQLGKLSTDTAGYITSMEGMWANYVKYVTASLSKIPSLAGAGASGTSTSNGSSSSLTTIDSGVKINGLTLNLSNVTDVTGLINQLKQLA